MPSPSLLSRILKEARRRISGASADAKDDDDGTAPPKAPAAPGVDRSANDARLRAGMEKIRENLRTYGTALGALATAVLTGLGYASLHAIFPVPAGHGWVAWSAAVFAVSAVGGSVWVTGRFFAAQRRIVFTPALISPPDSTSSTKKRRWWHPIAQWWSDDKGLTAKEREFVKRILDEHAREETAWSARALEMRALRLARVARRREGAGTAAAKSATPIRQEADRLDEVLTTAALRASLAVLESRSQRVFRFKSWSGVALFLAAGGVVGLFLVGDYAKGQRDLVALREACAKAVTAGAANACEPIDGPQPTESPTPTPAPTPAPSTDPGIARLKACAEQAGPETPSIPLALRERAIARCAGLPDVPPAGTQPSPLASVSPTP